MGRIKRSVKVLDKHYGKKWPFDIKLKKLDIDNSENCVLGQLYNDFYEAGVKLDRKGIGIDDDRYAFESHWPESGAKLTDKWRKRIKKLRKERKK